MHLFKKKEYMIKTNTKGFLILGLVILTLLLGYLIGNYNQFTIVKLYGENNNLTIKDSVIYFTPKEQKIYLENIKLNNKNINMKSVMVSLEIKTDNAIISIADISESFPTNKYVDSDDYFKSFKIIKVNNDKLLKEVKNEKNKLTLSVIIVDDLNQSSIFKLPIQKRILSNNKLFYLK